MEAAAIIGIVLFVLYVGGCVAAFGIPASLSDTYYLLGGEKRYGHAFSLTMFAVVMLILAYWFTITPESFRFLVFLSSGGLMLVGAAPLFKGSDSGWHSAFAVLCAVSALAWSLLTGHLWCLVGATALMSGIGAATRTIRESRTFWLEMVAFATVFASLIWEVLR